MDLQDAVEQLLPRGDLLHLGDVRHSRLLVAQNSRLRRRIADHHVLPIPVHVVPFALLPALTGTEVVPGVEQAKNVVTLLDGHPRALRQTFSKQSTRLLPLLIGNLHLPCAHGSGPAFSRPTSQRATDRELTSNVARSFEFTLYRELTVDVSVW